MKGGLIMNFKEIERALFDADQKVLQATYDRKQLKMEIIKDLVKNQAFDTLTIDRAKLRREVRSRQD